MLFLLCLSALLSLPASAGGFGFGPRQAVAVGPKASDSHGPASGRPIGSDLLADSLAKAFPANAHGDPAYASVLLYLSSLESKPNCHRTATAALVADCNSLGGAGSDSDGNSDSRYRYAAQLAVCEFEATGIRYPSECRGRGSRAHIKCIRRLEERPQWWTTLSNNIQNAMVICAAVGHDVEQGTHTHTHRPGSGGPRARAEGAG